LDDAVSGNPHGCELVCEQGAFNRPRDRSSSLALGVFPQSFTCLVTFYLSGAAVRSARMLGRRIFAVERHGADVPFRN